MGLVGQKHLLASPPILWSINPPISLMIHLSIHASGLIITYCVPGTVQSPGRDIQLGQIQMLPSNGLQYKNEDMDLQIPQNKLKDESVVGQVCTNSGQSGDIPSMQQYEGFALTVPSAWNALPIDIWVTMPFTLFSTIQCHLLRKAFLDFPFQYSVTYHLPPCFILLHSTCQHQEVLYIFLCLLIACLFPRM